MLGAREYTAYDLETPVVFTIEFENILFLMSSPVHDAAMLSAALKSSDEVARKMLPYKFTEL